MTAAHQPETATPPDDMQMLLGLPPAAWASVVLILGLLFTGIAAYREWHDARERTQALHNAMADASVVRLREPLEQAATKLRALQTVFLSNHNIDQAVFAQYNENLRAAKLSSQVITGFARRGTRIADRDSYLYEFVVPFRGNEVLLGLDIASQPGNLQALYLARDTDKPVISSPFALRQFPAGSPDSMGIVVRLPVYSNGSLPTTVPERRQREIGSLAASLRLRPLVEQALHGPVLDTFQIRVSDITEGPAPPFFDSRKPVPNNAALYPRTLDFGGRRWSIELRPRLIPVQNSRLSVIVFTGAVISALLSLLLWSLATTRHRAVALGQKLTMRYREVENRFRTLNELLPALVLLADANEGRILYANQAARLRLGETDSPGATLSSLFADPALRLRASGLDLVGSDWSNVEAVLITPAGGQFWANTSIARVEMEGRDHLLMVATDISEQRQLTEMLSYQASHDALTELVNRREFERRLENALAERRVGGESCALLYIDLDQFKLINDISGHMAGDQLLAQLALAMRQQLRTGDVLARLGGDEFGLIAFRVDAEGARVLAERLRECIEGLMFVWEGRTYTISASIGVVVVDHGEPTLKDLLAWADTACYQAKENGRNRVHVYRQDNETTRRQSEMEWANRLRWEVEEDRLLLDYQEIVPLGGESDTSRIELLLRLRDEQGGLILPGTFLPAAERYSLMPAVDRWVIQTALAHFNDLHPSGEQLGICAINLSGASIEDNGLADFILELISRYAVPPQKLCFEITETVAVRNLLKVVNVIERLRNAGCLIALDDFGAGMSSFGYLKNLPVDIIKIDGSFIRDLESDSMSRTIVNAIAQIGHQRGLKVVAEWVSSEALSRTLGTLGVDFGQGFALHRPERVSFQREG
ncbi:MULTISPECIES: EAL domain-containing protein [unclassified Pseudoxanthomonas]|uniref:bifunctional diguanylate cyclase/phosphodiesterase n=1 Tax=unclassified Pseudoxanthomonas TaxID=2645906 RepID=UPI003076B228